MCKHVLFLNSTKACKVYKESVKIGYDKVIWGFGSGIYKRPRDNFIVQKHHIERMIYKNRVIPLRIVIDSKCGAIWLDNLHTAIAYIKLYGEYVALKDIPIYIIDLRQDTPIIVDINGTVRDSVTDIVRAIATAYDRDSRVSKELVKINYKLRDFLNDNSKLI